MKRLHTLLFSTLMALCLVSFASCSDDDDAVDNKFSKDDLIGKWLQSGVSHELDCTPKSVQNAILNYYTVDTKVDTGTLLSFDSDNKVWAIYLKEDGSEGDTEVRWTYTITDNKIYMTNASFDNIVATATIKKGQLTIRYDYTEALQVDADNLSIFWEKVGVEKPENFKSNKFIETETFGKN